MNVFRLLKLERIAQVGRSHQERQHLPQWLPTQVQKIGADGVPNRGAEKRLQTSKFFL
jgi:hypothetical protein